MISKENIKYSLRNLWIRKSRSALTILSIFVGITTIFLFISYGLGLFNYVEDMTTGGYADKFTVQGKGIGAPGTSGVIIDKTDLDVVESTLGVFEASAAYAKSTQVVQDKTRRYVYLMAYDPKTDLLMESFDVDVVKGRDLDRGDKNKVLLGYNYQIENKIFPKALDVNDKLEIDGHIFKIIGFLDSIGNPQDDSNVYITDESYEEIYSDDESYALIVGRADINAMEDTVESVEKNLRKHRGEEEGKEEFSVASFADQIAAFQTVLNMIIGFIVLIALISVVVSAINTANTMVTSVLERVREIGVIKSIGARNAEIFNIFLFESSFLGFVAGSIGVFLGWILSEIIAAFLDGAGWGFLKPFYSITLFGGCILFATLVGTVSGVAPAINAAKRKPVDALRYE